LNLHLPGAFGNGWHDFEIKATIVDSYALLGKSEAVSAVNHSFKLVCLDYFDFTLEVYA
jgi:hypothetical protein